MIDSGCNSLLLPFPQDMSVLGPFRNDMCQWAVSYSAGTGAIQSPTLTIKHRLANRQPFNMRLALSLEVFPLQRLRFHITKDAALALMRDASDQIEETSMNRLKGFLDVLGNRPSMSRTHVLLGQQFLKDKMCIQCDPVFIVVRNDFDGQLQDTLLQVQRIISPAVEQFQGFHDLEDEDHEGDDEDQ